MEKSGAEDNIRTLPTNEGAESSGPLKQDAGKLDDAAVFLATTETYEPMTPEQEKKLVRKIDRYMIPLVSLHAIGHK